MNKVKKIKDEIERRYEYWKEKESNSHSIESESRMSECQHLLLLFNSLQEDPVSNDLEEACDEYYNETWDEHGGKAMVVDGCHDIWFPSQATDDFFKAGAQWQKKHLEMNRIKDCNNITEDQYNLESDFLDDFIDKHGRMPTFLDAIEYGMKLQKEQDQSTIKLAEDHAYLAGQEQLIDKAFKYINYQLNLPNDFEQHFRKAMAAEWSENVEKKKLGKIEDEEYNGEDYGIDGLWHAMNILEKTLGKVDGYQTDDGILEHKCAITAVKKLYEQKPTWSQEDREYMESLLDIINGTPSLTPSEVEWHKDWLKNLKQRIGG